MRRTIGLFLGFVICAPPSVFADIKVLTSIPNTPFTTRLFAAFGARVDDKSNCQAVQAQLTAEGSWIVLTSPQCVGALPFSVSAVGPGLGPLVFFFAKDGFTFQPNSNGQYSIGVLKSERSDDLWSLPRFFKQVFKQSPNIDHDSSDYSELLDRITSGKVLVGAVLDDGTGVALAEFEKKRLAKSLHSIVVGAQIPIPEGVISIGGPGESSLALSVNTSEFRGLENLWIAPAMFTGRDRLLRFSYIELANPPRTKSGVIPLRPILLGRNVSKEDFARAEAALSDASLEAPIIQQLDPCNEKWEYRAQARSAIGNRKDDEHRRMVLWESIAPYSQVYGGREKTSIREQANIDDKARDRIRASLQELVKDPTVCKAYARTWAQSLRQVFSNPRLDYYQQALEDLRASLQGVNSSTNRASAAACLLLSITDKKGAPEPSCGVIQSGMWVGTFAPYLPAIVQVKDRQRQ